MRPYLKDFKALIKPLFSQQQPNVRNDGEWRICLDWFSLKTPEPAGPLMELVLEQYPDAILQHYDRGGRYDYAARESRETTRVWFEFIRNEEALQFNRRGRLAAPLQKDEDGKNLCRGCGGKITEKRRRTWCSDACVEEHVPYRMEQKVWKRDGGRCQICRVHVGALMKAMKAIRRDAGLLARFQQRYPWIKHQWFTNFYQFDHIIPVSEGGGALGTANLRILCTGCHLDETRKLRKRIAEARRKRA